MKVVYAHLYQDLTETLIWPSMKFDISLSLQNFKKPLVDINSPVNRKKKKDFPKNI